MVSDDEGAEFRRDGLFTGSTRTEYCKVYLPKFVHLLLRDCFCPILKVDDSHDFPFCCLAITVRAVQGASIVEGRITYL